MNWEEEYDQQDAEFFLPADENMGYDDNDEQLYDNDELYVFNKVDNSAVEDLDYEQDLEMQMEMDTDDDTVGEIIETRLPLPVCFRTSRLSAAMTTLADSTADPEIASEMLRRFILVKWPDGPRQSGLMVWDPVYNYYDALVCGGVRAFVREVLDVPVEDRILVGAPHSVAKSYVDLSRVRPANHFYFNTEAFADDYIGENDPHACRVTEYLNSNGARGLTLRTAPEMWSAYKDESYQLRAFKDSMTVGKLFKNLDHTRLLAMRELLPQYVDWAVDNEEEYSELMDTYDAFCGSGDEIRGQCKATKYPQLIRRREKQQTKHDTPQKRRKRVSQEKPKKRARRQTPRLDEPELELLDPHGDVQFEDSALDDLQLGWREEEDDEHEEEVGNDDRGVLVSSESQRASESLGSLEAVNAMLDRYGFPPVDRLQNIPLVVNERVREQLDLGILGHRESDVVTGVARPQERYYVVIDELGRYGFIHVDQLK